MNCKFIMTKDNFNKLLEERIEKTRSVMASKSSEYSNDGDKLHNFRVASRIGGDTMAEALEGMMRKHLVSVYDLIKKPEMRTKYLINEKIGDMVNYLILLEAIMVEELKNKECD